MASKNPVSNTRLLDYYIPGFLKTLKTLRVTRASAATGENGNTPNGLTTKTGRRTKDTGWILKQHGFPLPMSLHAANPPIVFICPILSHGSLSFRIIGTRSREQEKRLLSKRHLGIIITPNDIQHEQKRIVGLRKKGGPRVGQSEAGLVSVGILVAA